MKVSIITSCFNRERTIRGCIESVLGQDYPDIEYIVVDGASTDNSLAVIKEYEDRITHIVSEPDRGMYEWQRVTSSDWYTQTIFCIRRTLSAIL